VIRKIKSYPAETRDSEISKELGLHRQTVAKYRKDIAEAL